MLELFENITGVRNFLRHSVDGVLVEVCKLWVLFIVSESNFRNCLYSYEWTKDGKPLGSVSNILFVGDGTLRISRFSADNEGIYQCFASNVYGRTMSSDAELRMARPDRGWAETSQLRTLEGRDFMIGCRQTTDCFPAPSYAWALRVNSERTYIEDSRRQVDQHGKVLLLVSDSEKPRHHIGQLVVSK